MRVRLVLRRLRVRPTLARQYSFVEIAHEIFSTVILSLLLNQDGQLSVSGERMLTLRGLSLPSVWLGKLTALDMTPLGWLGRKTSAQTNTAPCEKVSFGICGPWRPRSSCASAQSDQGLHCPLIESLDATECINRDQRLGWYFTHAHDECECAFDPYLAHQYIFFL